MKATVKVAGRSYLISINMLVTNKRKGFYQQNKKDSIKVKVATNHYWWIIHMLHLVTNKRNCSHTPFNLQPQTWFDGYPVKSNQIFIRCNLKFFRVAIFSKVLTYFFLIYKYDTKLFVKLATWKNLGRSNSKIFQVAPYKNLGRFYRVPFKSHLRVAD